MSLFGAFMGAKRMRGTPGGPAQTLPTQPTISASAVSSSRIDVTLTVASTGTAPITYLLERSTASNMSGAVTVDAAWSGSPAKQVTGLSASTQYYFRATPSNVVGSGTASAIVNATTNAEAPAMAAIGYTQLYDGPGGADQLWWNALIQVPWDNRNGDWLDSAGTAQGAVPYATFSVTTADVAVDVSVTALVQKWQASVNTGAFLKSLGSTTLWARGTAYPPSLSVTVGGTPYSCACAAALSLVDNNGTIGPAEANFLRGNVLLQFDLSGLPGGDVTAATLRVYGQGFLGASFEVYEINTPPIWTKASEAPIAAEQSGIASSVTSESVIGAHPDVVFSDTFPEGWTVVANNTPGKWSYIAADSVAYLPYTVAAHPKTGVRELVFDYTPSQTGTTPAVDRARGGWICSHSTYAKAIADGVDPTTRSLDEAYARGVMTYYDARILFQGEKSGLAMEGRMGGPDGNGGNTTHGVFIPSSAQIDGAYLAGATSITIRNLPANWAYMNGVASFTVGGNTYLSNSPSATWDTGTNASGKITITIPAPGLLVGVSDGETVTGSWYDGGSRFYTNGGVQGVYSGWSARVNAFQSGMSQFKVAVTATEGASTITMSSFLRGVSTPCVYPGDTFRLFGDSSGGGTTYTVTGAAPLSFDTNGQMVVPITPSVQLSGGIPPPAGLTAFAAEINKRIYDAYPNPYKHLIGPMVNFYNPLNWYTGNGWFAHMAIQHTLLNNAGTLYPQPREFCPGSRATGYPRIPIGEQASYELRCKLNTLQSDPDMFGNCTPNYDGLMEFWVEGVKVMSCGGLVYRRHAGIKIEDPMWVDWYIGGQEIPTIVETPTRRGFGACVAATSYIGPVDTRPSWMRTLPLNTWYAVPNSDLYRYGDRSAVIAAGLLGAPTGGDLYGVDVGYGHPSWKFGYSGGAARQNGIWLMVHGNGGAVGGIGGGWRGNDVDGFSLELETPAWANACVPTDFRKYWCRSGGSGGGLENALPQDPDIGGTWYSLRYLAQHDLINAIGDPSMPDVRTYANTTANTTAGVVGQTARPHPSAGPNAAHMYNSNQFIDSLDRFVRFGAGPLQEGDNGSSQFFDSFTWSGKSWEQLSYAYQSDSNLIDGGVWTPGYSLLGGGGAKTKHPVTEDVYYHVVLNGGLKFAKWVAATNTNVDMGTDLWFPISSTTPTYGAWAIDPDRNLLLWRGITVTSSYPYGLGLREYAIGAASLTPTVAGTCTLSGPYASTVFANYTGAATSMDEHPFLWSQILGKFLFYRYEDQRLYTIERIGVGAYYVDRLDIASAAVAYTKFGGSQISRPYTQGDSAVQIYNRLQEFPKAGILAMVNGAYEPVWVVRLV